MRSLVLKQTAVMLAGSFAIWCPLIVLSRVMVDGGMGELETGFIMGAIGMFVCFFLGERVDWMGKKKEVAL